MRFEPTFTRANGEPCGTLCEQCQKAVPHGDFGCSWSQEFVPVSGWTAVPTLIVDNGDDEEIEFSSYCVMECPEFIADEPRILSDPESYIEQETSGEEAAPADRKTGPYCDYNIVVRCERTGQNKCAKCGWKSHCGAELKQT